MVFFIEQIFLGLCKHQIARLLCYAYMCQQSSIFILFVMISYDSTIVDYVISFFESSVISSMKLESMQVVLRRSRLRSKLQDLRQKNNKNLPEKRGMISLS